jgi:formylglycine-generating enzyme required for sulfatase activity
MGSPAKESYSESELPSHEVILTRRFAIGRYPITFSEFDHFCEMTGRQRPSNRNRTRGRFPVTNVTWRDAQVYLTWLSEATRQEYRLPTEAEWEYACRSGTTTAYSWGAEISPGNANYRDTGADGTSEVGVYPANPWGMYDMHGNVYEWCSDGCRIYDGDLVVDPIGPVGAKSYRAARGGSWYEHGESLRSASRARFDVESHFVDLGFRCARYL